MTPLHGEVWEPLPCGSLSQSQGGSLALAFCEAAGVNESMGIHLPSPQCSLCLYFHLELWRAPSDVPSLPVPQGSTWGSVVDDLVGFHSLSPPRINKWFFGNSCPSTGLIPAGIPLL